MSLVYNEKPAYQHLTLVCHDKRLIQARRFHYVGHSKGVIVINSALGVKQDFYQSFAEFLSNNGYEVITWDPRGIGASRIKHAKFDDARLHQWGEMDLETVIEYILQTRLVELGPLTLIGHSSGGHLAGLAPSLKQVQRLIFIASGTGTWRRYPLAQWPRLLTAWYLLFPFFNRVLGYVPGRLGIGHDLPKGVAEEWCRWCRSPDYLFSDSSLDTKNYREYAGPINALAFTDDRGYAPPVMVEDLLKHFPKAQIEFELINPKTQGVQKVGHFGFFNKKNDKLWPLVLEMLRHVSCQSDSKK